MFSNLTSSQALPVAIRVSSQPTRFFKHLHSKSQHLPTGSPPKPPLNPIFTSYSKNVHTAGNSFSFLKPTEFSNGLSLKSIEMGGLGKPTSFCNGFRMNSAVKSCASIRARSFSGLNTMKVGEGRRGSRAGKPFSLLKSRKTKETRGLGRVKSSKTGRSSWEESADRLPNLSPRHSSWGELAENSVANRESRNRMAGMQTNRRNDYTRSHGSDEEEQVEVFRDSERNKIRNRFRGDTKPGSEKPEFQRWNKQENMSTRTSRSSWDESAHRLPNLSTRHSSLDESAENSIADRGSTNRVAGMRTNRGNDYTRSHGSDEEEEEEEVFEDSERDKFRNRFRGDTKPEFRRWNKHENVGRKTWKEATESSSSVPKMLGEGLYGVGPVLAAFSAGRREFYALYVQEGLALSSNNRKRKDKKGFEKVLKMAENMGLSVKEASKHDLNMVVGNRPHQGLVLDASPLEMVKIKELEPIPTEEDSSPLWVALDEVTDPQNLGAIIRSAYFFGASGVILCAKNSAPLSGVVSKASAGSLELMELRYCNNMMQFLISSAENGWRVLGGSVSSNAIALNEVPPGPPTVLVLGSEGTGLRPLVERSCSHLVKIPGNIPVNMASDVHSGSSSADQFRSFMAVESLNVSVAAGVLIHHLIGHHYNNNCQIEEALD